MSAFVCFSRRGKPCDWFPIADIKDKTTKSISSFLKLQKESLIAVTPYISRPLEPNSSPLADYPELAVTEKGCGYQTPPCYVRIVPEADSKKCSIFVQIKTQLPDEFPLMEIFLDVSSLSTMKASQLLDLCVQTFALKMTEPQLLRDETPVDPDETTLSLFNASQQSYLCFKCVLDESEHKRIKTRACLAAETVSSEEVYVKTLHALSTYWKPAFKESKIFDDIQMRLLFGDVDRILKVHESLLADLHRVKIGYAANFGAIFLNYVDRFKVSTSFVSNFKNVDELIKTKKAQSRFIESKLREIDDNNPDCNGQDFMGYYITPVQRYPRYPLLVRDLGKNTASFHPDKEFLSLALQNIDNANKNLDRTSHRVKQLLLMEAIQEELSDKFFLMEEGRELVLQNVVRITKPKSMNATLYLFNDLVLLCTKTKKQSIPIVSAPLCEFRFCNGRPSPYSFTTVADEKEYVVSFNDYDQKMVWMEEFVSQRNVLLANVGFDKKFVKWTEVELGESVYPLMNHDGIYYDSQALFIGGVNASMAETSSIITYSFETSKWSTSTAPFEPRANHTVNLVDTTIYVSFGLAKNTIRGNIWRCPWGTTQWQKIELQDPSIERYGHSSVVYQGKIIYYGGKNDKELKGDVVIYDPASNTAEVLSRESMPNAPTPRAFHAAAVVGDSMVVVGGRCEKGVCGDFYVFDLKERQWTDVSLAIPARMYHKIIVYNQYLFVIGGMNAPNSYEMDVINSDGWSVVPLDQFGNTPTGIFRFAAVYLGGGRVMTHGGMDSYGKTPFGCSWILDVKEGFNEDREYVPKKRKSDQRQIVHLNLGSEGSSDDEKESPAQTPEEHETRATPEPSTAPTDIPQLELKARANPSGNAVSPRPVSGIPRADPGSGPSGIDFASILAARSNLRKRQPEANMSSGALVQTDAPKTPQKQVWPEAAIRNPRGQTPMKKDMSDPVFVMPKLRPVPGRSTGKAGDQENPEAPAEASVLKPGTEQSEVKEEQKPPVVEEKHTEETTEEKEKVPEKSKDESVERQIPNVPREGGSEKGHRKSALPVDRPGILAGADSTCRRNSLGNRGLSSAQMSVQEFYDSYNIDISKLNVMQQSSTRMKVVRLLQAMKQNDEQEAKVMKLEALLSGKPPPDTPMILKIVDDMVKKLIKITTSMSFEEVREKIFEKLGRTEANLTVQVASGVEEPLTEESLMKAESAVFTKEVTGLIVTCPL